MRVRMLNGLWSLVPVLLVVFLAGCPTVPPNGNTNTNDNDNEFTLGAETPNPADVEARPQSINPYAASQTATIPPAADLTRDLPPIGDQGQLGSCTAWAAGYSAATYSANRRFGWGAAQPDHQASAGYLYERLLEEDALNCGSGTLLSTAVNILIREGCASFQTVSYSDQTCSINSPNNDAPNFQIGSFNRVLPTNRYAIRGELAAGRIIVFGGRLYTDFMNHVGPGVYRGNRVFLSQGNQHAAHAMAVVGYDDTRGAYRIMNSWGRAWGDNGFMWMAYETFEETVFEAYAIEHISGRDLPDPPAPGPSPNPQAFLDAAFQFVDVDPVSRQPFVYLVFFWHFDAPVFVRSITVTDPSGVTGRQDYNAWYTEGYVYFVQTGGFQWTPGTYGIEFDTQTAAGNDVLYSGEADIAPLDGGGPDPVGSLCSDICIFAYDGVCDDGGPGAEFNVCDFGTDCFDCGVRDGSDGSVDPNCNDSCRFARDGECDDGRPGAVTFACPPGTDCTDCGPSNGAALCSNSCPFAFDGECDDGGVGADFFVCDFGTDCADCGPRAEGDRDGGNALCQDTCTFAFDGECDDGGQGSDFDICDLGTDCADCGPRNPGDIGDLCLDTCAFAFDGECDDGRPGAVSALCPPGTDCTDCDFGGSLCDDSCEFAFDGVCDDGGPGAEFFVCDFGTDCTDCGPRSSNGQPLEICLNSCEFAFDGECDDGGPGADFAVCDLGSDCADCGVRFADDFKVISRKQAAGEKPDMRTRQHRTKNKVKSAPTPVVERATGARLMFRGIPVETPASMKRLPAAGVRPTTLGANRKPVTMMSEATEATPVQDTPGTRSNEETPAAPSPTDDQN